MKASKQVARSGEDKDQSAKGFNVGQANRICWIGVIF
jgi:hypothetical protein